MNLSELIKDETVFTINEPPNFPFYLPKTKHYGPTVEVRTEPKIGRNQLCPCGSGVKFKKCCGK